MSTIWKHSPSIWRGILIVTLFSVTLITCIAGYSESGSLWPDSARYGNAALMIQYWLTSDQFLNPLGFAETIYRQYPGFSVPYHPPIYPGLLSLALLVFGSSYLVVRILIALFLALAVFAFMDNCTRLGQGFSATILAGFLLLSMPELIMWSRDTMSEVPAIALFLVATSFFLRWYESSKTWLLVLAFVFAELSFLSRVTTIGLMPIWYLWLAFNGRFRDCFRLPPLIFGGSYIFLNLLWIKIVVAPFAQFELSGNSIWQIATPFHVDVFSFYLLAAVKSAGWGTVLLACSAAVLCALCRSVNHLNSQLLKFWSLFFVVFIVFLCAQGITEHRYVLFATLGIAGMSAASLSFLIVRFGIATGVFSVLIAVALNVALAPSLPNGIVGFDRLAQLVDKRQEPGNVLTAIWYDQDFMFRYQLESPSVSRTIFRSDRVLAVRTSSYSIHQPRILVTDQEGFLETLRKGRIRFILTCDCDNGTWIESLQTPENKLTHQVVSQRTDLFEMIGHSTVSIEFTPNQSMFSPTRMVVFLWRYTAELESGEDELEVPIPNSGAAL